MKSEQDKKYRTALMKYKTAKHNFDKALSQYNLLKGEYKIGDYYSVSGIKIDIPFVPSSDNKVKVMVEISGGLKGKKCADLGCGDGKVVLAMLQQSADAYGFELEPKLIRRARKNLQKSGYSEHRIIPNSFMTADLSSFNFFTVYGISSMMEKLETKLLNEANDGTLIASNTFLFPHLKEIKRSQNVHLYLIEKEKEKE